MRASARSLPRFPDASAVRFLLHLALACVVSLMVLLWMLPSPRPVRTDLRWQPLDSVDFELVDHRGNRVTRAELLGQPTALFFGFTSCPEICPTTLSRLMAIRQQLGAEGNRLKVTFVSVDPERDTQDMLATYVSNFAMPLTALSGAVAQIDRLVAAFGAVYVKTPTEAGGYTVDHTALVYLLDAQGGVAGIIAYDESQDSALAKVRLLLESDVAHKPARKEED